MNNVEAENNSKPPPRCKRHGWEVKPAPKEALPEITFDQSARPTLMAKRLG